MDKSNNSTDKNNTESDHSLLNESDFVSLMEAELAASNPDRDDTSKQRTWNNIQSSLSHTQHDTGNTAQGQKKSISRITYYSYIAATFLILAITLPVFFNDINPLNDGSNKNIQQEALERIKGINETINVNLTIYTLDKTGKLIHSNGQHNVGTTLLFKVHSPKNGIATIITSRNGNLSNNGFLYDISQKKLGQLLSHRDKIYGYMVEPTDKILQFCIFATESKTSLNAAISSLDRTWAHLDGSACSTINVTDS